MVELDPIFTTPIPYGDTVQNPVLPEDETSLRNLIEEILHDEQAVHTYEVEDDERIDFLTKSAEYKLPNGDRVYLQTAVGIWNDPSENIFPMWDMDVFTPVGQVENHLLVRRFSFSFTPEEVNPPPEDVILKHHSETGEVKMPGEPSLLDIDFEFVLKSLMQTGFHDVLDINNLIKAHKPETQEEFDARYERYALEQKLNDAINIYGPEKHKWLKAILDSLKPTDKVTSGLYWKEAYIGGTLL
jgi:hypothetical protein